MAYGHQNKPPFHKALGDNHLSPSKPSLAKATPSAAHLANRSLGVHDTTLLGPPSSGVDIERLLLVDAEADPSKHTLIERLSDECVSHNRVVAVGAHLEEEVGRVLNHAVPVGRVGLELVDFGDEALVEVELADVRGLATRDGVVGELGCARVDDCCFVVSNCL